MRNMNDWLVLVFWAALGMFAIVFAFYVASILIPVLLFIIAASGLASFISGFLKRKRQSSETKIKIETASAPRQSKIIDAEYEIIDEK